MTTAVLKTYSQDPGADKDYGFDWSDFLGSDTVFTSTWVVSPAGPTLHSDTHDATGTAVWIKDVVVGERYVVTNKIVSTGGLKDEKSLLIIGRDE